MERDTKVLFRSLFNLSTFPVLDTESTVSSIRSELVSDANARFWASRNFLIFDGVVGLGRFTPDARSLDVVVRGLGV